MFANKCDDLLNGKEEHKKIYMDKYGKSWDEIVKLAYQNNLEDSVDSNMIVSRAQAENECKKDPNYLDDKKRSIRYGTKGNKKKK